ncbi:Flp family type IVb pilin [Arthrobacter sp. R4]|uniref:Flp family type IVb pilin n=1 Tax=Arthrobacter sp. R4 TaxID=644417 RepID=UPI003ED8E701
MTSLMVSMTAFIAGIKDRLSSEKGATATEYSLLIAFVAFAIIVGAALFGTALSNWFSDLGLVVDGWTTGPASPVVP